MILSKLKPFLTKQTAGGLCRAMSDHHEFVVRPSRWQWTKFKDLFHFYLFLGAIPLGLITLYANVFVGPAKLTEIPEDYTPKYWEYYKHPITRFIAQYILNDPQQDYEKYLAYIFIEGEKRDMRQLEGKIKALMKDRLDYQAYYYRPVAAKYHRVAKESFEKSQAMQGD